jgi:2-phosphosulfolactate phosphatase
VAGKTIVFTTTNGTKAMTRCMGSARLLVGAIINRAAVCQAIAKDQRIDLVCAGTNGDVSLDDALGAGALVDRLSLTRSDWQLNDAAEMCHSLWQNEVGETKDSGRIANVLSKSIGGRNLIKIGMKADLPRASELDRFECVPELDRATWEITG